MKHLLSVTLLLSLLPGCERPIVGPTPEPGSATAATKAEVIITGFNDRDTDVVIGPASVRVGWYYDFSAYDSLLITFSARRLSSPVGVDYVMVKIGPACYVQDSLFTAQKDVSLRVRREDIAKAQSAALTFLVRDTETSLALSRLRVTGWITQ